MMKPNQVNGQGQILSALIAASVAVLIFGAATNVSAQGQKCEVGTRVQFEDGGRGIATIKEIGTERPHVGWYLLTFDWNPKGDWYEPKTWGLRIAGTNIKCAQPTTTAKPQPPAGTKPLPPGKGTENPTDEPAGCPMTEPPGKVTKTSAASAPLFKRVIYERAAAKVNPDSISAPKKVGLTFLEFKMETPYKNTLTNSRFGDKRRHDGAPVGAMIYPLKTKELQCDLHGDAIRRTVTEVSRDCFKNRDGDWTCPGRTTKFVETKLIPVK